MSNGYDQDYWFDPANRPQPPTQAGSLPPQMFTGITQTQSYTWVLREVFLSCVKQLPFFAGFTIKRNRRVPIQTEDIPLLGVYILDEQLSPDGDGNAGDIRFLNTFRIGFQVVIKNNDDADAEQKLDAAWWAIMNGLWRDQYITSFLDTWNVHTQSGNPDNTRFEAVVGGTRRHTFGNMGANNEYPVAELQYDATITYRSEFAPIITDPLDKIITTTGIGTDPGSTQQVVVVYDFTQAGPPYPRRSNNGGHENPSEPATAQSGRAAAAHNAGRSGAGPSVATAGAHPGLARPAPRSR